MFNFLFFSRSFPFSRGRVRFEGPMNAVVPGSGRRYKGTREVRKARTFLPGMLFVGEEEDVCTSQMLLLSDADGLCDFRIDYSVGANEMRLLPAGLLPDWASALAVS